MRSIGIRELRQHASQHLRDVERGETIEVTDRGRPIAMMIPIPPASALDQLGAAGRLRHGVGDWQTLGPPLPSPGVNTGTAELARIREHEE